MLTGFSPGFLSATAWPELEATVGELATGIPDGIARQSDLDLRVDISAELGRITAPTLVIGNAHDQMVPVEQTRALHGAIPGADYAELESGHLVLFERPEELATLIEEFADRAATEAAAR